MAYTTDMIHVRRTNSISSILFRFTIIFDVFWGAHAWFTWNLRSHGFGDILISLFFISAIIYQWDHHIKIVFSLKNTIAFFSFFIAWVLCIEDISPIKIIRFLMRWYPILILYYDQENNYEIMKSVKTALVFFLIPGIILYLFFVSVGFPKGTIITYPGNAHYTFYNYIFLLKGIIYEAEKNRFMSIFLEPSYLGTLCAFLLYADKYRLKNKLNLTIFITLIFSFSLAAYIITFVGYIYTAYIVRRITMKNFISSLIIMTSLFFFIQHYTTEESYLNKYIISRLQIDSDANDKFISGNNRNSELTDFYFVYFAANGDLLRGIGTKKVTAINGGDANAGDYSNQIRGAGYKIYFITYGIISALFYLIFYCTIGGCTFRKRDSFQLGFLTIIVFTFIQASYPSSLAWVIPYILGINSHKQEPNVSTYRYKRK